jgi:hypothetical protein
MEPSAVSRFDLPQVTRDVFVHALGNFVSHADHNVLFRRNRYTICIRPGSLYDRIQPHLPAVICCDGA